MLEVDVPGLPESLAYHESPHHLRIASVDIKEPHDSLIGWVPPAEGADEERVHDYLVAMSPQALHQSRELFQFLRPAIIERTLTVLKKHGHVNDRDPPVGFVPNDKVGLQPRGVPRPRPE